MSGSVIHFKVNKPDPLTALDFTYAILNRYHSLVSQG